MRLTFSLLAAATALLTFSQAAQACEADGEYVGAVCFTAATFCPDGYLEANGQIVNAQQYQALFSLVGNKYGGTTNQTFGVPDLRGRSPVGQGTGPGLTNAQQYTTRGGDSTTLSVAQMPAHTHSATATTVTVNATTSVGMSATPSADNNQLATASGPGVKLYAAPGGSGSQVALAGASGSSPGSAVTLADAGGGTGMPTVSPQLVMRACIATRGDYPIRPD